MALYLCGWGGLAGGEVKGTEKQEPGRGGEVARPEQGAVIMLCIPSMKECSFRALEAEAVMPSLKVILQVPKWMVLRAGLEAGWNFLGSG